MRSIYEHYKNLRTHERSECYFKIISTRVNAKHLRAYKIKNASIFEENTSLYKKGSEKIKNPRANLPPAAQSQQIVNN